MAADFFAGVSRSSNIVDSEAFISTYFHVIDRRPERPGLEVLSNQILKKIAIFKGIFFECTGGAVQKCVV